MDLAVLNAARRWWLDNMPWIGHVPTDDEVLEAYANRDREHRGMLRRRVLPHFWWLVIFAGLAYYLSLGLAWPDRLAAVPLAALITLVLAASDPDR